MNKSIKARRKGRLSDGLLRQNVVLMSGLLVSPVVAAATTLENAVLLSVGFSLITFLTILICRFIPRKITYAVRIVAYAVIASIVYIPVVLLLNKLFAASTIVSVGIYLPILITNPIIMSKTETRFYLRSYGIMMLEVLGYIAGFVVPCITIGIIRDVLVNSSIGWATADVGFNIPALETTFGGFIMVGVLAGLVRAFYNNRKKSGQKQPDETIID